MKAIVYTSNTGHTERYAKMLGEKTGLPVYSLCEATKNLEKGSPIVYLGWLFVANVKGYKKAAKNFNVSAVVGVGLCDTGTAIPDVKKANAIPDPTPIFTMQGGMDKTRLRGINAFMIKMLIKMMSSKENRTKDDERMLYLLLNDKDYVSEENTAAFCEWYENNK